MSTNNTKVFETYESEVRSYCRNFPTVFVKAKGSIQTDENGKNFYRSSDIQDFLQKRGKKN